MDYWLSKHEDTSWFTLKNRKEATSEQSFSLSHLKPFNTPCAQAGNFTFCENLLLTWHARV